MIQLFNPKPEAVSFANLAKGLFKDISTSQVVYCSGPMTTGLNRVKAIASGTTLTPDVRSAIFKKNCEALSAFVKTVSARIDSNSIIIDPTSVNHAGWGRDDYLYFWTSFITHSVGAIHFMEGWQYSDGCIHEFLALVSRDSNPKMYTHDGTALTFERGRTLIKVAADWVKDRQTTDTWLADLYKKMTTVLDTLYILDTIR